MSLTTLIIQPDGTAGKDTYIRSATATTNYGTSQDILLGTAGASTYERELLQFDFSPIPATATIVSVVIGQTLYNNNASKAADFSLFADKRVWVEAQATWNVYSTGNAWATAGSDGANDYTATVLATLGIAIDESYGEKQWVLNDAGVAVVQAIVAGGTNYGFLIFTTTDNCEHTWRSSDYTVAAQRPRCTVVYNVPDPVVPSTSVPSENGGGGAGGSGVSYNPWTSVADFEAGNVYGTGGFTSSVGTGLAANTTAPHFGAKGLEVTLSDTTARYGVWSSLGNIAGVETEFWFYPGSAVLNGLTPICEVVNYAGYGIARINVCKPTGTANYIICLSGRNLLRSRSDAVGEMDYWWTGLQFPTITNYFHKLRMITKVRSASEMGSYYTNLPGGMSSVPEHAFATNVYDTELFIDDVYAGNVSGKYSQEQGRLDSLRYGVTAVIAAGASGALYFDDVSWAPDEGARTVPTLLKTSIGSGSVWTIPAYSTMVEGETKTFSLLWNGCGKVTTPTCAGYFNLEDISTTIFPTGTDSSTGNIQTSKPLTALTGGNTYVICFSAYVDGNKLSRKHRIKCVKPGEDL